MTNHDTAHTVEEALDKFTLVKNTLGDGETTACAMSLLAWIDGASDWTDRPECAHRLLVSAVIAANDAVESTPESRREVVVLGVLGVLDTWWMPDAVVVRALAEPDVPSALRWVAQWRETRMRPDLTGADLHGANLYRANLYRANLRGADLRGANLTRANLHGANLYRANLYRANLRGANLLDANLHDANLHDANLHDANLHDANLHGANLHGANLHGANLRGATIEGRIATDGIMTREKENA